MSYDYQEANKRPLSFLDNELAEELRRNIRDLAGEFIESPCLWDDLRSALSDSLAAAVCEKIDNLLWDQVVNTLCKDADIRQWARDEVLSEFRKRQDIKDAAVELVIERNTGEIEEAATRRLLQDPELQRMVVDELKSLPELREQAINEIKMSFVGVNTPLTSSLDEAALRRAIDNMLYDREDDADLVP